MVLLSTMGYGISAIGSWLSFFSTPRLLDSPSGRLETRGSSELLIASLIILVDYGLLAAAVRTRIISRPRTLTWMRPIFAGAFVLLGARLALAER
jgi:threonine/homoserine/homoserine lactone efflux protein